MRAHQRVQVNRQDTGPIAGVPSQRKRRKALRLLLRAFQDAEESGAPAREFAVEIWDFRAAGMPMSDLRWLVWQQYAEHLLDVSPRGARQRKFRHSQGLAFSDKSCFVLTASGVELARSQRVLAAPTIRPIAVLHVAQTPRWDAKSRELWLGDVLVRRFRTRSVNQERILTTFQEAGWPVQIDDPLPPNDEAESERRLHDAITKLNRHHLNPLIRFRGDGSKKGVCWELVRPSRI